MDTLDDLKNIWQTGQALNLPEAGAVKSVVEKYQKSKKRNVILLLAVAVLLLPAISVIFYFTGQKTFSVVFGEVLMMAGAVATLFIKIKNLRKINADEGLPNADFLKKLKQNFTRKPKASFLQIFAMACFSIGYAFYIFDYIKADRGLLMAVFSGIGIYGLLAYFVLRPFSIKKSREKAAKMLAKIAEIQRGF